MVLRIFASIILFISVLFMPFWLTVFLVTLGIIYFNYFWEGVAWLLLSNLLYGVSKVGLFDKTLIALFGSVIILMAVEVIKKKLNYRRY